MPPIDCVIVGVQPPPLHGLSAMNARIARFAGKGALVVDLAARAGSALPALWAERMLKALRGTFDVASALAGARRRTLYVAVSGGWGQAVEVAVLALGRIYRAKLIVHHHSFAYLDRPSPLPRLLVRTAGRHALHVVLCGRMRERLRAVYGRHLAVLVVSNAAFLPVAPPSPPRTMLKTVSFLGNLSRDKGVLEFLEIAERMRGSSLEFRIAGPCAEAVLERVVRARIAALANVTWVGAVYGASKEEFLRATDVLLFPTHYRNEADPLVVYEALAHGAPVIAARRGCLASMVDLSCGRVLDDGPSFVSEAVSQLQRWSGDNPGFAEAAAGARLRYEELQLRYRGHAKQLLDLLSWPEAGLDTAAVEVAGA